MGVDDMISIPRNQYYEEKHQSKENQRDCIHAPTIDPMEHDEDAMSEASSDNFISSRSSSPLQQPIRRKTRHLNDGYCSLCDKQFKEKKGLLQHQRQSAEHKRRSKQTQKRRRKRTRS